METIEHITDTTAPRKWLSGWFVALAAVLLMLPGCSSTKEVVAIATAIERPKPAMPLTCHHDKGQKFKPVDKVPGDKTPIANAVQALQSNKSRIDKNEARALDCECWVADTVQSAEDQERLGNKCVKAPVAEPGLLQSKKPVA